MGYVIFPSPNKIRGYIEHGLRKGDIWEYSEYTFYIIVGRIRINNIYLFIYSFICIQHLFTPRRKPNNNS